MFSLLLVESVDYEIGDTCHGCARALINQLDRNKCEARWVLVCVPNPENYFPSSLQATRARFAPKRQVLALEINEAKFAWRDDHFGALRNQNAAFIKDLHVPWSGSRAPEIDVDGLKTLKRSICPGTIPIT